MTKIDKFFVKQSKSLPVTQPDAHRLDAADSKQKPTLGTSQNKQLFVKDIGVHTGLGTNGDPREDSMDIDQQVQKHQQQQAGNANSIVTPLMDSTNLQQAPAAVGCAASQQAADACDSPKPAVRTEPTSAAAAEPADQENQQEQEQLADGERQQAYEHDVCEAMDVDGSAPAIAPAEGGSPLAAKAGVAPVGTAQKQPTAAGTEPTTPVAARLPAAASTPGGTTNTSTAKVPLEAYLTPEQRKQLLEACEKEVPLLEAELDVRPDLADELLAYQQQQAASSSKKGQSLDLKYQVSILAEGQSMPLTQLAQHISSILGGSSADGAAPAADTDAGGVVSALAVRNIIQDAAGRKSYGLQDGLLANVDALEDATASFHWCWELRTLTGVPKPVKQAADAARKRRKQVLDRLKAVSMYIQLAQGFTKSTKTAEAKLAKAAAKLSKLPALGDVELPSAIAAAEVVSGATQLPPAALQFRADANVTAEKAAAEAAREAEKAEKAAAKEADAAAKAAEKAAKAAAKAAAEEEKARQKAEADQKREEARKQREAEAARKASEAAKKKEEAAKKKAAAEAVRKGFHSITEMQKAQGALMSFMGKAVKRTPTPAAPSGDTSQGDGSQHEGTLNRAGTDAALMEPALAAALTQQQRTLMQQLDQELPYFSSAEAAAVSIGSTGVSPGSAVLRPVAELLSSLVQHWREVRKYQSRVIGLPPSWAQRPGAAEDPSYVLNTAIALYGQGVELSRLRCFRRKLIKHHDSVRPAFYGSMSQKSRSVHGRKPFGQDVELDYEVESDQDWEEEPEGESLSDDANDDEDAAGSDGEEDEEGFVVGDGYLSDDEGMREAEDEAPDGCVAADSNASEQAALAQLEAGLQRALQRGRPLVLVNNCPEMSWEPTSNLDPSLLLSLKGSILDPAAAASIAAPPTPAQLWHLYSPAELAATAAAAAAAAGSGGSAAQGANAIAAAAEVAGSTPGGGGSGGGRGRPVASFPELLLPALVAYIQENSTLTMDKLVAGFVDVQAALGVKLAKARVKDKVKEITTMKMVAKAPKYTVKPEYLQLRAADRSSDEAAAEAAAAGPPVDAGVASPATVGATAAASPMAAANHDTEAADAMQVDDDVDTTPAAEQHGFQDQAAAAASTPASAGMKRTASDAAATQSAADANSSPALVAADTSVVRSGSLIATAGPPAKKQKTPLGIERFFGRPQKQQQQQQQETHKQEALQEQQRHSPQQLQQHHNVEQQQQQLDTPPSTPKRPRTAASPDAAVPAVHTAGGVLPMLTPPSHDIGVDRPTVSNSPVPFRMNAAATIATADAEGDTAEERPPVNRWHAQANCRGMGLQGGNAGCVQQQQQHNQEDAQQEQQQQQASQPFAGFDEPQQQQQPQQHEQQTAANGHARPPAAAAAARAGGTSSSPAAAAGTSSRLERSAPQAPEDGELPSLSFWRQLASWIISVRDPCPGDIEQAFEVFGMGHLENCIHTMPQTVLTAMVKTLGSASQGLPMRAACAYCIGSTAICFAKMQLRQAEATVEAAEAAAGPSSSPQAASAVSPGLYGCAAAKRSSSATPSPNPRSAPVHVSIEELCAEPGLMDNFKKCMTPDKILTEAKDALSKSKRGSSRLPSLTEAEKLAKHAVRAVAALLRFGVQCPIDPPRDWQDVSVKAAQQLRMQVARDANWRGVLNMASRSPCRHRSSHALMCMWALLSDPASAKQYIPQGRERLARLIIEAAAACGKSESWVVHKWALMVASAFLAEESFREMALPKVALGGGPAAGADEAMKCLEGLGCVAMAVLKRCCTGSAKLSQPRPDQCLMQKALSLSSLLVQVLNNQKQLNGGKLPGRLAAILHGHEGGDGLADMLQDVAMQDEWDEAAERARSILTAIAGTSGDPGAEEPAEADVEMQDF